MGIEGPRSRIMLRVFRRESVNREYFPTFRSLERWQKVRETRYVRVIIGRRGLKERRGTTDTEKVRKLSTEARRNEL